jgi:hypothetical protein
MKARITETSLCGGTLIDVKNFGEPVEQFAARAGRTAPAAIAELLAFVK